MPPLKCDVYHLLRQRLCQGEFAAGQRLPALRKLAEQYDLSVAHVHQAIVRLDREGLVEVRHGSGVYAADLATHPRRVLLLNAGEGDYWGDFTRALAQVFAADRRSRLLFEVVPESNETQKRLLLETKVDDLVAEGIDAIVFNGMKQFELSFLRKYAGRVPLVGFLSDGAVGGSPFARVVSDWFHGGYIGMRHLIEIGCRRVVVTRIVEPPVGAVEQVCRGAEASATDSLNPVEIIPFVASLEDPIEDTLGRFEKLYADRRPDGVFAHADWAGSRLLTALRRRGVRVPEEVAVLGYYDTPWTIMTDPPMSSIATDHHAFADAIYRLCGSDQLGAHVVIKPRVVARESTVGAARRPQPQVDARTRSRGEALD